MNRKTVFAHEVSSSERQSRKGKYNKKRSSLFLNDIAKILDEVLFQSIR